MIFRNLRIKNIRLILFAIVEIILLLTLILLGNINEYYFTEKNEFAEPKQIFIPQGTSISKAAQILADSSIIDSKSEFLSFARLYRRGKDIKFGIYQFNNPVSAARAFDILNSGSAKLVRITFPEGIGIKDFAGLLSDKFNHDSTLIVTLAYDPEFCRSLDVPASSLEGFLLPETYLLDPLGNEKKTLTFLVSKALNIYNDNSEEIARSGKSILEIATMASLVEGECQLDEERTIVASVYYNRLKKNMPLQADPTIQYIIPGGPRRLRNRDLQIKSPYNTYMNKGLPPGPINNPGRLSILASIYPDSTDFLYFVARGDGGHYFAENYKGHLRNKAKFDKVRRDLYYKNRRRSAN